jgi:hypothetical protein
VEKFDRLAGEKGLILRRDMSDVVISLADEAGLGGVGEGTCGGLIFAALSHWKWQWAVLDSQTLSYLHGISPRFDTAEEAERWITYAAK